MGGSWTVSLIYEIFWNKKIINYIIYKRNYNEKDIKKL